MFSFVSFCSVLLLFPIASTQRVNIGKNCINANAAPDVNALRTALEPTAQGLANVLVELKKTYINQLNLLFVLDSQRTFASVHVNKMDQLAGICKDAYRPGVLEGRDVDTCYIAVLNFKGSTAGGESKVNAPGMLGTAHKDFPFDIHTKTELAKTCLERVTKNGATFQRTVSSELLDKATETNKAFEPMLFGSIYAETAPTRESPVLIRVTRDASLESAPTWNRNFDVTIMFFSPNDQQNRVHALPLIGVLSPGDKQLTSSQMTLEHLLQGFGIQLVIVSKGISSSDKSKIQAAAQANGIRVTEEPPTNATYIQDFVDSAEGKFPLTIASQVLYIGKGMPLLLKSHKILSLEALPKASSLPQLKQLTPPAPTSGGVQPGGPAAPPPVGAGGPNPWASLVQKVEAAAKAKITGIEVETSTKWNIPSAITSLDGRSIPVKRAVAFPKPGTLAITNLAARFKAWTGKPNAYYDASVHPRNADNNPDDLLQYLLQSASVPTGALAERVTAGIADMAQKETEPVKIGPLLKSGGVVGVFKDPAVDLLFDTTYKKWVTDFKDSVRDRGTKEVDLKDVKLYRSTVTAERRVYRLPILVGGK